jgi:hypothetical protein
MNSHDRIAPIVFAGQQALSFEAINQTPQSINLAPQVGFDIFPFAAQIEVGGYIVAASHQINLGRQHIFQAFFLTHDLLRLLWIRPKSRVSRLLLDFG